MTAPATWEELAATGRGSVCYWLEIHGVIVLGTSKHTPAGNDWYDDAGYESADNLPLLVWDSLPRIKESLNFLGSRLSVGSIRLKIADVRQQFISKIKSIQAGQWTRITATIDDDDTSVSVESTSGWASSGYFWIEQERIEYTGTTATSFTGLTRGTKNTIAAEHYCDLTIEEDHFIPDQPIVSEGPDSLTGLRATLHAAVMQPNGEPGASSVIYRGRVRTGSKVTPNSWELAIQHISDALYDKVAARLPSSPIVPGFWFTGRGGKSTVILTVYESGVGFTSHLIAIPEGWYTKESLAEAWNDAIDTEDPDIRPRVYPSGGKYSIISADVTDKRISFSIVTGSVLWCLGFDEVDISTEFDQAIDIEANEEPRLLSVDWSEGAPTSQPEIRVTNASKFTPGLAVRIPGHEYAIVESVDTTDNIVTLESMSQDSAYRSPKGHWFVEDSSDLVLYHAFVIGRDSDTVDLITAIKRILHLDSGQLEPEKWCVHGMVDDDFDWDEWDAALNPALSQLKYWRDAITEEVEAWRIVGPTLGLLGVCARITAQGRIGACRVETPVYSMASEVQVDSRVWDLVGAKEASAIVDSEIKVNGVRVKHSRNYTEREGSEEWPGPIEVYWDEGTNRMGKNRTINYECGGLFPRSGSSTSYLNELAAAVSASAIACHFGVFGRAATNVDIPCAWTSRQLKAGDLVRLTHPTAPDLAGGAIGVEDRLAVITGRMYELTGRRSDILTVRIGPEANAGGIAPSALADSWDVGSKTLTCSDWDEPLFAQDGQTDLDAFVSDEAINVRLRQHDSKTPDIQTATIVAGGVNTTTGTVALTSDPWGGGGLPTGGVVIEPAKWDNACEEHKFYTFIAGAGNNPTLGSGGDPAFVWTI